MAVTLAVLIGLHAHADETLAYSVSVQTVLEHDDGEWLWFHPRTTTLSKPSDMVMTIQKHLQKSDHYSGLHAMYSRDGGATWTEPVLPPVLEWTTEDDGTTVGVCDVTPGWHAPTGKLVAVGVKVRYQEGLHVYDKPQSHAAAYTIFDPETRAWAEWKFVDMPDPTGTFYITMPGCTQWLVAEDGDLLVPIYFREGDVKTHKATVMRCGFDGSTLTYKSHGDELSLELVRGLVEPSLTRHKNRYYLTIRNDERAYVTASEDGISYAPIKPWIFDDGEELGSYNTQQHWITHSDSLFLVYTRRGAENDHIMRNRAPLFMAQVDPEKLQVIRATERILIPERGAALGNFGAVTVSPTESWVTVSEGIWNDAMRSKGATGATFIARIKWDVPNRLATP
jgi:hypothetical protein